ncbi:hypothetical protein QWI17_18485 [Gilvimarinus sp. SDUM040013]|uniref:Uncharacterized protein n=1 Tax=Gilvimarinus gilvus TaxID=3058038 RepID=A0ABU4RVA0_9GAMM|nr:hypothetical protein [Gilvimarinus sp. SDUM040013]MDO3387838.1 hypothetical protein [Gilvimarinus sp. SDUM040013]MDX6848791.1 hypothetical protein [Gilvimarinus sp. SDUM040013]
MALKTFIQIGLLGSLALGATFAAKAAETTKYDERVVEEVVVSAKGWRKTPEPLPMPKQARWQIDDDTREKLSSRIQLGYDPVLEDIRNTDNRIKVRSNVREPEPSTIFRVGF